MTVQPPETAALPKWVQRLRERLPYLYLTRFSTLLGVTLLLAFWAADMPHRRLQRAAIPVAGVVQLTLREWFVPRLVAAGTEPVAAPAGPP